MSDLMSGFLEDEMLDTHDCVIASSFLARYLV